MPKKKKLREYRFNIAAYEPETLPMGFLADCLNDLSEILGNEERVHLVRVERGFSASSLILIDEDAEQEIKETAKAIKAGTAPQKIEEAEARLNRRLRQHNTRGEFIGPRRNNILLFPGVEIQVTEYGPFSQPGTIDGVPVVLGGTKDLVPVHLEGRAGEPYNCLASRSTAKEIAPYLFTTIIRAFGDGRWVRHPEGQWEMKYFKISGIQPLAEKDSVSVVRSVEELRAIPAEWKTLDDPIEELKRIRYGS